MLPGTLVPIGAVDAGRTATREPRGAVTNHRSRTIGASSKRPRTSQSSAARALMISAVKELEMTTDRVETSPCWLVSSVTKRITLEPMPSRLWRKLDPDSRIPRYSVDPPLAVREGAVTLLASCSTDLDPCGRPSASPGSGPHADAQVEIPKQMNAVLRSEWIIGNGCKKERESCYSRSLGQRSSHHPGGRGAVMSQGGLAQNCARIASGPVRVHRCYL